MSKRTPMTLRNILYQTAGFLIFFGMLAVSSIEIFVR